MTHDELLKEIDFELRLSDYDTWREGAKALRAVVELHKPTTVTAIGSICKACGIAEDYPCPTIQVIQKELK